jgi:hypothetical protein
MFGSWREYRDYLLRGLINKDADRAKMAKSFELCDRQYFGTEFETRLLKMEITTILRNDVYLTKLHNFMTEYDKIDETKRKNSKRKAAGLIGKKRGGSHT